VPIFHRPYPINSEVDTASSNNIRVNRLSDASCLEGLRGARSVCVSVETNNVECSTY
jgi:hypothetical protein